ncbi:S8/S53 family peptidase [Paenibacillus sp. B01]|uniref:S8/S53 family peptidase n=1 Tax=Paenibacillus sp. B01 TaxID=2660554 RepID=UPI0018919DDD|nr:S8/S53 family peptidase [Paenibacillus sp. B01]
MPAAVTVFVMDTGFDPDAAKEFPHVRLHAGFNMSRHGSPDDSSDPHGHGTAVARTLLEACGPAPIRLVPVRLLDRRSALWERGRVADALERILRELPEGPTVVCAAFGDGRHLLPDEPDGQPETAERIRELRRRGVAFVAAAGNFYAAARRQRCWGMSWPASCPDAVSVGAAVCGRGEGRRDEADGCVPEAERLGEADGGLLEERLREADGGAAGGWMLEPNSQRAPAAAAVGGTTLFAPAHPPGHTSGAAAFAAGRLAALCSRFPGIGVDEQLALLLAGAEFIADDEGSSHWPLLL